MRIAQLCTRRYPDNTDAASESMVLIFDCLRVGRLTGERPADNHYKVKDVTGQEKNQPPASARAGLRPGKIDRSLVVRGLRVQPKSC